MNFWILLNIFGYWPLANAVCWHTDLNPNENKIPSIQ
jgi:hypothetical protein